MAECQEGDAAVCHIDGGLVRCMGPPGLCPASGRARVRIPIYPATLPAGGVELMGPRPLSLSEKALLLPGKPAPLPPSFLTRAPTCAILSMGAAALPYSRSASRERSLCWRRFFDSG